MTQEEKQLLFKDLCARLPYGVKVRRIKHTTSIITIESVEILNSEWLKEFFTEGVEFKPYLRPMSSMTDDERNDWYMQSKVDYDCEFKPEPTLPLGHCHLSVDWLNKKGFDYRGLIPMGLALEAKEWLYN